MCTESRTSSERAVSHNGHAKLSGCSDEAVCEDFLRNGAVLHLAGYDLLADPWHGSCPTEVIDATLAQAKVLDLATLNIWTELLKHDCARKIMLSLLDPANK